MLYLWEWWPPRFACLIKVPRWSLPASSLRKVRQDGLVRTVYQPTCVSASGGVELQCWLWLYSLVFTDFFFYLLSSFASLLLQRKNRKVIWIPHDTQTAFVLFCGLQVYPFSHPAFCASKDLLPAYATIILAFYHFLCSTISFVFPLYPPVTLTMSANQLISLLFLHRPNLLKAG